MQNSTGAQGEGAQPLSKRKGRGTGGFASMSTGGSKLRINGSWTLSCNNMALGQWCPFFLSFLIYLAGLSLSCGIWDLGP